MKKINSYRMWQRNSFFRSPLATSIFAKIMGSMADPVYHWALQYSGDAIARATSICDVGAGNGIFLRHGLKGLTGKSVTLVDQSASQLAAGKSNIAKMSAGNNVAVTVANAETIPLDDGIFDLVVSTGSINLWSSPSQGLSECLRLVKPGGEIWVIDQAPCKSIADYIDALFVKRIFGVGAPGYTLNRIIEFGKEAGLPEPRFYTEDHSVWAVLWQKPPL